MDSNQPSVAIGVYPRERYSTLPETLRALVRSTTRPYTLILIDCLTPKPILRQMEEAVAGVKDVRWIRLDQYVTIGKMRNLINEAAATQDYVCHLESSCSVEPGWLEAMIEACQATGADIATPNLSEYTLWGGRKPHHDIGFGEIVDEVVDGKPRRRIAESIGKSNPRFQSKEVIVVQTFEVHVLFFSRAGIRKMGLFDEELSTGSHVDMTCVAIERGMKVIFVPGARMTHFPTMFLDPLDRDYFMFRWDIKRAERSCEILRQRWNVMDTPEFYHFAFAQHFRLNPFTWYFGYGPIALYRRIRRAMMKA